MRSAVLHGERAVAVHPPAHEWEPELLDDRVGDEGTVEISVRVRTRQPSESTALPGVAAARRSPSISSMPLAASNEVA